MAAGLLASVSTLIIYWLTLCPTVYVEGSGELIGAVCGLGTPHPPGYPLYCVLGRLACASLPPGREAMAVNLFTAITAAAAAGALAAFLRQRGMGAWPAYGAALLLGFSRTYWSQAVVAEVYGLATLFLVLSLWAGLAAASRPAASRLVLAGYIMGLGVLVHPSQMLVWPGLMAILLWRLDGLRERVQSLSWMLLGGVTGLSLALYLPLRSGRGVAFHWTDIETASQFWEHISLAIYRSSFFALPPAGMLHNAERWLTGLYVEFHPLVVPVWLTGVFALWQRDRRLAGAVLAMVGCNLVAVLNYHRDPNGIVVFFLPTFLALAVLAAAGLDWMRQRAGYSASIAAAALLPMVTMMGNWATADRSSSWIVRQYGLDILADLPAGAVLLAEGDDAAFAVDYLLRVAGERPDVTLYNRQGRGTDLLSRRERQLPAGQRARRREQLEAELLRTTGPVYFMAARDIPARGFTLVPDGLVYRAVRRSEGSSGPGRPPELSETVLQARARDPWARKIQANYWFMLGEHARARGDCGRAAAAYEAAALAAHDSRTTRHNVAVAMLRCGRLEEARTHAVAACRLDPWFAAPYRVLARLAEIQGRHKKALKLHKRAVELGRNP